MMEMGRCSIAAGPSKAGETMRGRRRHWHESIPCGRCQHSLTGPIQQRPDYGRAFFAHAHFTAEWTTVAEKMHSLVYYVDALRRAHPTTGFTGATCQMVTQHITYGYVALEACTGRSDAPGDGPLLQIGSFPIGKGWRPRPCVSCVTAHKSPMEA